MDNEKIDDILEEEYSKCELVGILLITVTMLLSYLLSSDLLIFIIDKMGIIYGRYYMYAAIIMAVAITGLVMRVFGKKITRSITKFWLKLKKKGGGV